MGCAFAKRINGSLKCVQRGEPKGDGRAMEATECLGQRRYTLAVTISMTGRPSKSRLNEDAECKGGGADRKHGDHHVGHGVDHRHGAVAEVRDTSATKKERVMPPPP
jgi:hypothetical protein